MGCSVTEHAIHHNANFPQTRLTVSQVKKWRPKEARTLLYYRDDESAWRYGLGVLRELAELGVKNNVIINTETLGGTLVSRDLNKERLVQLLSIAATEYSYFDNAEQRHRSPIHILGGLNEIDTLGWDDGEGGPITTDKIIDYTYDTNDVGASFGIPAWGPSFLGGPLSDMVVAVCKRLAFDGFIKNMELHVYGRSVNDAPTPGWIWGTIEQAINDIITYCGDMQINYTEMGCWTTGNTDQESFVRELCAYNHARLNSMYLFCNNDWVPSEHEYTNLGKDFGLVDRNGLDKPASHVFNGGLVITKPQPPEFQYVLGFRDFYHVLLNGGVDPGMPLENEWGVWPQQQIQETHGGTFIWAQLPSGGKLTYTHREGNRKFRWQGDWPTFQEG